MLIRHDKQSQGRALGAAHQGYHFIPHQAVAGGGPVLNPELIEAGQGPNTYTFCVVARIIDSVRACGDFCSCGTSS